MNSKTSTGLDSGDRYFAVAGGLIAGELAETHHAPGQYTLSGSISAAPEPASYALMLAGMGLVGLLRRRGRRPGSDATA